MNTSIGTEIAFDKIQHPFMIKKKKKKLNKVGVEGTYLKVIQTTYKPTVNIIINTEKLKLSPLRSGTRQECPFLPVLFNIIWKS